MKSNYNLGRQFGNSLNVLDKRHGNPNDELYTRPEDVKAEFDAYPVEQFNEKALLLPFDTTESAFWKYFTDNAARLGLRRVVCSHISDDRITYWEAGRVWTVSAPGGVDFFGEQGQKLLDGADLVISNPPFSLIHKTFDTICAKEKGFALLAHQAIGNRRWVFDRIVRGSLHMGHLDNFRSFTGPDGTTTRVPARIFTNLKVNRKPGRITLDGKIEDHACYDGTDILIVRDKLHVPDYNGLLAFSCASLVSIEDSELFEPVKTYGGKVDGVPAFVRCLFRKKGEVSKQ